MGSIIPTWRSNSSDIGASTAIEQIFGPAVGSRKRSASSSSSTSDSNVSTKRFKLNTFDYVYQKLFVEGLNSDVQVHALGHTWRLHRFYLEQCDYFRALFQGNWCDSSNHEYTLNIEDENICFTGLNNVFASLYNNEIEMDEEHISGVCGAASLLNLTSVLDKCNAQLAQYVRDQSKLLLCLKLADRYGFEERMAEAMSYLKLMFCQLCTDMAFLRGMTQPWLIKLLSADVLCVRENELGLYTTMRNWIFLNECPDGQLDDEKAQRRFFHSADFQWRKYADLLRQIRVPHLVTLQSSLKSVTADGLIPMGLLDRVVGDQWRSLLQSEESPVGGSSDPKISDQDFYTNCFRLGRTGVNAYSKTSWRWRGYFFGVDLLVNYDFGFLRLTRNCTVAPIQHQISIKHVDSMKLHYRCIICSEDGRLLLDTQRQSRNFPLDRSVELGAFKLLPKGESISVHLFYLPFLPIRQPPTHYWDQLGSVEEQQPVDT